jgi:urea carboxylase-associated protein 1
MPPSAPVAELVDAADSKSVGREAVLVRVRPGAPSGSICHHQDRGRRRRRCPKPAVSSSGTVLLDEVVAAGGRWSRRIAKGERLRIIDLEGKQAVDFLVYDADAPTEGRYNAANTMKFAGTIHLTAGHQLFDDVARPMMTILEDSCGRHDTIGGCCSAESNLKRYGKHGTPSCKANFLALLREHGLDGRDLVMNVNFFMNVPVQPDGAMAIEDGWSKPGDHVDLEAEMDVLCLISNCPQVDNPCNGFEPTPIRIVHYRKRGP